MPAVFEEVIVNPLLLDQALQVIRARLDRKPNDAATWRKYGAVLCRLGYLIDAAAAFERVVELEPTDDVSHALAARLSQGRALPVAGDGPQPALYVALRDFLPAETFDALLPKVLELRANFGAARVGGSCNATVRPDHRQGLHLAAPAPIRKLFRTRLRDVLRDALPYLGLERLEIEGIEVTVRACLDGDFFRVHRDENEKNHRKVSFAFFFHREPKAFSGGDLLLFDSDLENGGHSNQFTRILPKPNTLVMFRSSVFHTVTNVRCESGELKDGRLAVNGHIRRRGRP